MMIILFGRYERVNESGIKENILIMKPEDRTDY